MPSQSESLSPGTVYARPLPFVRRASDRRIEVFSPKLGRRLSLSSYAAWQLWLALEANPLATTFCERPTLLAGSARRCIDFWVRFARPNRDEFWLLDDADAEATDDSAVGTETLRAAEPSVHAAVPDEFRGTSLRLIPRRSLLAWSTPTANWAQIVPHLVTWRRFSDPLLAQSIVVYLGQPRTLDNVVGRFTEYDSAMTQGALFSLVAAGRVLSPDLATSLLSGSTTFRRA